MESKLATVDNTIDIKEDITMTNQDTMVTNTTYSEINFSNYFGTDTPQIFNNTFREFKGYIDNCGEYIV